MNMGKSSSFGFLTKGLPHYFILVLAQRIVRGGRATQAVG
jgi:hypothetical protein